MQNIVEEVIGPKRMTSKESVQKTLKHMWQFKALYLMSLPGILYFIIFKYVPLAGSFIAFQDYNLFKGMSGSEFVGLKHFYILFKYGDFVELLTNTLIINAYDITIGFLSPLVLALMINEITHTRFKKFVQQTVYLPHFLSWTILGGITITQILSPESGILNMVLAMMGIDPIYFMIKEEYARLIVVVAGLWRDTGWGTILYLAAIIGINPSIYEAARVDGAGRLRQVISITIPALIPIIVTLFLLKVGHFLDFGFERVWVFMNPANRSKLEIFDTYIYQAGILEGRFSYTTAVGLFKSTVGVILLFVGNTVSKRTTGEGLF